MLAACTKSNEILPDCIPSGSNIAVFGDSFCNDGNDFAYFIKGYNLTNLECIGGRTLTNVNLNFIDLASNGISDNNIKAIVINAGINDLLGLAKDGEYVLDQIEEIINKSNDLGITLIVNQVAPFGGSIHWNSSRQLELDIYNNGLKELSNQHDNIFIAQINSVLDKNKDGIIDALLSHADGLHPSPYGSLVIANEIALQLRHGCKTAEYATH